MLACMHVPFPGALLQEGLYEKSEVHLSEHLRCWCRSPAAVSKFYSNNKRRLGLDLVLEQAGFDDV